MFQLLCFTGGFTATNSYLLTLSNGDGVLVDAPEGVDSWPELQEVRLRALLITHAHFDHVMGAAAIASRFHCPIHAFAQPGPNFTLEALLAFAGVPAHVPSFTVDVLLTESSSLSFGGLSFQILHVPGHSPDSLCFLPEETDSRGKRIAFTGDVLFNGSIGRTDFPQSDHSLLLKGIREKLYVLPDETLVYPGHGPSTRIGHEKSSNPFVRVS